ncbi:MAG TPA: PadR family transcriptional regulator [Thermoanaerobaculia bacterium]|nr:PadR family transcriptional regulator [Thermoanaerobaculia bacterium]
MSVENILLGLLGEARSGYDLKKDFDGVFSHFWAAEQSQIYRTLKSLEERGMVESSEAPSDKGPPRKLYRRTEPGRRQLLAWLAGGPEIPTLRFPYLAQLFFMGEAGSLEQTERWLAEMVEECEARLVALSEIEAQWAEDDPTFPDLQGDEDFHAHLVLRHGLARARAAHEWAVESLERTRRRRQRTTADGRSS